MNALDRPVVIIDGANAFIRHYCANPSMSAEGEHVGGMLGFLTMVKNLVEKLTPRQVIVVWDGVGGSSRRRALYPDYKANRKPVKLNRFYEGDIPDTEKNRVWQMLMLTETLKQMPIVQIHVNDCEADDVIAHLCRARLRETPTVIVSSDKDFYQLLGPVTTIWSPSKKLFVTPSDVMVEYGMLVSNFALAKAVCGDGSDNISGVRGVGFKKLVKAIPELALTESLGLSALISLCEQRAVNQKRHGILSALLDAKQAIELNMKLVDLNEPWMIGATHVTKIDHAFELSGHDTDRMAVTRRLNDAGITKFDVAALFMTLRCLSVPVREDV